MSRERLPDPSFASRIEVQAFLKQERRRIRAWESARQGLFRFLRECERQNKEPLFLSKSEIFDLVSSHRTLARIRNWYRFLFEQGYVLEPVYEGLVRKRPPKRIPMGLTTEEVEEWLSLCRSQKTCGLLDHALLETAYGCGLRSSELHRLELADVDLGSAKLSVRLSKTATGRTLPIPDQTAAVLSEYLHHRQRLPYSGRALWVTDQATKGKASRLKARILYWYRPRLAFGSKISLRALRHSFATHLLESGASIRHIQALLGHAHLDSTLVYTRVSPTELQSAYRRARKRLGFPD